ncbi:hypothetical protein [Nocardioides albertanoniae]|nr:hypothetical protein [Nocardioides albertanoniae]
MPDFVLPGTWMQCPVGDIEREEHLLGLISRSRQGGEGIAAEMRRRLDRLRVAGGDQIFLRQDRPTLLTLTWPRTLPSPAIFAGHSAAIEALRAEAGGDATQVRSQQGFHIVRAARSDAVAESSTYWIAHPASARTLVVDVTDYEGDRRRLAIYDSIIGLLSWKDTDTR